MDGVDRLADVGGVEPAGEHHAALVRTGAVEVPRVFFEPGQVEHGADLLSVSFQDGVPRAMTVLAGVELDEVRVGLVLVADEDRDAEDGLGRVE